jgi:hypothetical protein
MLNQVVQDTVQWWVCVNAVISCLIPYKQLNYRLVRFKHVRTVIMNITILWDVVL